MRGVEESRQNVVSLAISGVEMSDRDTILWGLDLGARLIEPRVICILEPAPVEWPRGCRVARIRGTGFVASIAVAAGCESFGNEAIARVNDPLLNQIGFGEFDARASSNAEALVLQLVTKVPEARF